MFINLFNASRVGLVLDCLYSCQKLIRSAKHLTPETHRR